jgi:hypothetical protein
MPRSRRRTGVRKGKTQTQLAKAHRHAMLMRRRAAQFAQIKRDEDVRRFLADDDKYANYPGNRI